EGPIDNRWEMEAHVAHVLKPPGRLETAVLEDHLTALVTALGPAAEVAAHAFAYARYTLPSHRLAARVRLLAQTQPLDGGVQVDDGAASAEVQALLGQLTRRELPAVELQVRGGPGAQSRTARLGELADHGMVRRRSGNRVPEAL